MANPHPAILRLPALKHRTALSRSTIYKFIAAGRFDTGAAGAACSWLESEIFDQWIAERVTESRESTA